MGLLFLQWPKCFWHIVEVSHLYNRYSVIWLLFNCYIKFFITENLTEMLCNICDCSLGFRENCSCCNQNRGEFNRWGFYCTLISIHGTWDTRVSIALAFNNRKRLLGIHDRGKNESSFKEYHLGTLSHHYNDESNHTPRCDQKVCKHKWHHEYTRLCLPRFEI